MNVPVRSYEDLVAWQKARELGLAIYRATSAFPDHERFGLTAQLRRAGVSVASNIAEGYGRGTRADYLRFLRIARGSVCEIETQLLFASDLGYLESVRCKDIRAIAGECGRVLGGLIRSIENSSASAGG